jgi:energy-coupling factor transport system permease protein
MEGIVFGQYVPGNSFVHKLDPRTKIISSVLLLTLILLLRNSLEYILFGFFVVLLYLFSRVAGSLIRILKPTFYLVIFILVINIFFTPGEVMAKLGIIIITREGLEKGLTMGVRLIYLICISSVVTLTTSPVRLTDGLEALLAPFKRIGCPTSEIAMMMNIALRFIPTFWEETDKIQKAQASRGADFDSWHPGRRIKYSVAMLVPLFISAFRRADELAAAMESRGYAVGMERTSLYELHMGLRDYIVLLALMLVTIIFLFLR